jgi:probable phosphoglycerate mutase
MLTKPTQVFLLRHGESNYNALSLYQGCSDRPILTDAGRQQAQVAAQFLQNIPFSKIYTSHLKRVQQTSQIIFATLPDSSIPLEITK